MTFAYFKGGIRSKGHSPIYKVHKYFARRPHNVFNRLVEQYSSPGDLIVDCFGGGGVTLIEALTLGRRVVSCDINPVSSFIQHCQVLPVDANSIKAIASNLGNRVKDIVGSYYETPCRKCSAMAHVRWCERAYLVKCPHCSKPTSLRAINMKNNASNDAVPGTYCCTYCHRTFRVSEVKRIGSEIVRLRYRCGTCMDHRDTEPIAIDIEKSEEFSKNEMKWVRKYGLDVPTENIPEHWDRQKEDLLLKKGFRKFSDLFTPRNRVITALFFALLNIQQGEKTFLQDEGTYMLFLLSSLLRYTNNMNFSTEGWMDGRPVAWAKHAYWTPNQFVEVNPIEYFRLRTKAAISAIKDRNSRFGPKSFASSPKAVYCEKGDYCVVTGDSSHIELPRDSVDLVLTDPPYGSNVQYGELCYFWYVWLRKYPFFKSLPFDLTHEAVAHRKGGEHSKDFEDYEELLRNVFVEAFRILKEGHPLVFTFNNKNKEAWLAVIRAALDAGFSLEPKGVAYQEGIDAYRDTAHLRFEGTPQGDYVLTFIKISTQSMDSIKRKKIIESITSLPPTA